MDENNYSQQQNEQLDSFVSFNQGHNSDTALQIRLNPTKIIQDLELFLRGSKTILTVDDEGNRIVKKISIGRRRANEIGIQAIVSFVTSIVNSQTVQGNYSEERYNEYVADARISITEAMVINVYEWELKEEEVELIIDTIMQLVEPFMSRPINNKERDSYSSSIRTVESNNIGGGNQGGLLSKFNPFKR